MSCRSDIDVHGEQIAMTNPSLAQVKAALVG
jgi:hypothetical protein